MWLKQLHLKYDTCRHEIHEIFQAFLLQKEALLGKNEVRSTYPDGRQTGARGVAIGSLGLPRTAIAAGVNVAWHSGEPSPEQQNNM